MAKITTVDGTVVEGSVEEIAELMAKFSGEETEVTEPEPLQVGDYVVVIGDNFYDSSDSHGIKNGTVLKITSDSEGGRQRYLASDGTNTRWFVEEDLRKATEAEVSQAEADAIERKRHAIFTSNGRKPNEYREGDIVRVIRKTTGHTVGTIGEIVKTEIHHYPMVKAKGDGGDVISLYSYVEPVTFVENRLDRN